MILLINHLRHTQWVCNKINVCDIYGLKPDILIIDEALGAGDAYMAKSKEGG